MTIFSKVCQEKNSPSAIEDLSNKYASVLWVMERNQSHERPEHVTDLCRNHAGSNLRLTDGVSSITSRNLSLNPWVNLWCINADQRRNLVELEETHDSLESHLLSVMIFFISCVLFIAHFYLNSPQKARAQLWRTLL